MGSEFRDRNSTAYAKSRQRTVAWGRRVVSTFFVAWLAIAAQPCVMAAEVGNDCPHCPPAEQRELPPCVEVAVTDCAIDDRLSAEPRNLQLEDSPGDMPVAISKSACAVAAPALVNQPIPDRALLLNPGGPPRNVLLCVYLK